MILLGLLLILACAALAVDAVVQNSHAIHVVVFNHGLSHLSPGAIFVAGLVVGLLVALGLAMIASGLGRTTRRRRERRAALAEAAALRADNERLTGRLGDQEANAPAYPEEPAGGRHRLRR
jgi:hypothetical protein